MKKILAVLLAVMMIFSAMSVAMVVYAEDAAPAAEEVVTTGDDAPAADSDTSSEDYPSWLTELIQRLIVGKRNKSYQLLIGTLIGFGFVETRYKAFRY